MECLGCNFIESSPVKLRDGRTVCSQCECWRLECEARYALGLPDRRAWLEKVRKRRGEELLPGIAQAMEAGLEGAP